MKQGNEDSAKGFTVIELLLVLALISVMASFSVVFYSRFLTQSAVQNVVDQLVGQMQKARSYAVAGRNNSNWGVSLDHPLIVLYAGNNYLSRDPVYDEKIPVSGMVSIAGLTDLNFSKVTGSPSAAYTTINVSGGNNLRVITINLQGVISR